MKNLKERKINTLLLIITILLVIISFISVNKRLNEIERSVLCVGLLSIEEHELFIKYCK